MIMRYLVNNEGRICDGDTTLSLNRSQTLLASIQPSQIAIIHCY